MRAGQWKLMQIIQPNPAAWEVIVTQIMFFNFSNKDGKFVSPVRQRVFEAADQSCLVCGNAKMFLNLRGRGILQSGFKRDELPHARPPAGWGALFDQPAI